MKVIRHSLLTSAFLCGMLLLPSIAAAQGTLADYERAAGMRGKDRKSVV